MFKNTQNVYALMPHCLNLGLWVCFALSLFKAIVLPPSTCYTKLQTGQVELSF